MSRWAVRSFLDTVAELRPDQREIILGMFYRRFVARLTDDKEPMYRALHAMNRAFVAMRKGGFSDEQWVDVQELMEVVNQGRLKERLEIHREAAATKNQKIADRHSKIPADAFHREWSDPRAPRDKNERARALARKYGTSTDTVLRRVWNSPDLPDTEVRCDDDLGGNRWEGGHLLGSSSLRQSGWSPSVG